MHALRQRQPTPIFGRVARLQRGRERPCGGSRRRRMFGMGTRGGRFSKGGGESPPLDRVRGAGRDPRRLSESPMRMKLSWLVLLVSVVPAWGQEKPEDKAEKKEEKKPDFPTFEETSKDFEKVVSTADGTSFYGL